MKGWLSCHANSLPQINPTYQNGQVQTSQNNFFNQQQQQQQQSPPQSYPQPLRSPQFPGITGAQTGNTYQAQSQCQPNPFSNTQQVPNVVGSTSSNPCQQQYQMPCNSMPQQSQMQALPPGILEQIRACLAPSGPIFILPNSSTPLLQSPQNHQNNHNNQALSDCPGTRVPCGQAQFSSPSGPQYYSYPMPMPIHMPMSIMTPFMFPNNPPKDPSNCSCCSKKSADQSKFPPLTHQTESREPHVCTNAHDDTICSKRNCPSAINLQALASQLLAVPGIISCAITRMILRKVPGSNITNSMEEIMDRSRKALNTLTKEQMLTESRNSQQVSALINLHMTANPPASIIPTLTTIQLKVNVLKNLVDTNLTRGLIESQGIGAEGNSELDSMILSLKSDEELRQLLATLRQKECDERVNLSFAPYRSQRVIAESHLRNVETKIRQVEGEIEKRRDSMVPGYGRYVDLNGSSGWHAYSGTLTSSSPFGRDTTGKPQTYDSPDPFHIELRRPKRLNLKPHVGSPETTYEREIEHSKETSFNGQNYIHDGNQFLGGNSSGNECFCGNSRANRERDEEDQRKEMENREDSGNSGMKKMITFATSSPERENPNGPGDVSLCSISDLDQDKS